MMRGITGNAITKYIIIPYGSRSYKKYPNTIVDDPAIMPH